MCGRICCRDHLVLSKVMSDKCFSPVSPKDSVPPRFCWRNIFHQYYPRVLVWNAAQFFQEDISHGCGFVLCTAQFYRRGVYQPQVLVCTVQCLVLQERCVSATGAGLYCAVPSFIGEVCISHGCWFVLCTAQCFHTSCLSDKGNGLDSVLPTFDRNIGEVSISRGCWFVLCTAQRFSASCTGSGLTPCCPLLIIQERCLSAEGFGFDSVLPIFDDIGEMSNRQGYWFGFCAAHF